MILDDFGILLCMSRNEGRTNAPILATFFGKMMINQWMESLSLSLAPVDGTWYPIFCQTHLHNLLFLDAGCEFFSHDQKLWFWSMSASCIPFFY